MCECSEPFQKEISDKASLVGKGDPLEIEQNIKILSGFIPKPENVTPKILRDFEI